MKPRKNGPQHGGSVVICLSAEVKLHNTSNVGVNALKSESTTGVVCKSKILENGSSTSAMFCDSAHENDSDKGKDPVIKLSGLENVRQSCRNLADCSGSAELKLISSRASDVVIKKFEIEVEREEVVDCREEICNSCDGADKAAIEAETGAFVQEQLSNEVPIEEELSTKKLEYKHEPESSPQNHDDESINPTRKTEYSRFTNVSQELKEDAEKFVCNFDLNQEVSVDEIDGLENQISNPSSKQWDDCLDIDLNMNDCSNEKEPINRKSVKLELDLNYMADDGDETPDYCYHSATSSSLSKHHSMAVNLDLNTDLVLDGGGGGGLTSQLLSTDQDRRLKEEDRLMSPPTGLVATMKRTEPDSGLEPEPLYPFKHHQYAWI